MKKRVFPILIFTCVLFLSTFVVFALDGIGFMFNSTITLNSNHNQVETSSYESKGVNLKQQVNIGQGTVSYAVDSHGDEYVQILFQAKKHTFLWMYSNLSPFLINIYSPGWVGGIWNNQTLGTYKFLYQINQGAVYDIPAKAFDY